MLNRKYRLRRSKAFHHVYRRGRSVSTQVLSLVYVRSGPPDSISVGFSVSKKIGNSVVRNHVKRLMRENCRLLQSRIKKGYWLVFVARTGSRTADFHRIGHDMAGLLTRANLLTRGDCQ